MGARQPGWCSSIESILTTFVCIFAPEISPVIGDPRWHGSTRMPAGNGSKTIGRTQRSSGGCHVRVK